jgi:signal transduction histidine kinase
LIDFEAPSMAAAARTHVESLRWRLAVWGLFALAAACVLGSFAGGAAWFLALVLVTGFDALLGSSFLHAHGARDKGRTGSLFVWGCAFSAIVFTAMPLYLVAEGGGPGRVLGVLMAASLFVRAMLFLSRARGLMLIVSTPAMLCLGVMPFVPFKHSEVGVWQAELGVALGVIAFLAYVQRAVLNQNNLVDKLAHAHRRATESMREAQAKRAEAEEASRAKAQFLAMMTHELRTPLNAVIGYSEILNEDLIVAGNEVSAADAARVTQSALHLLSLIDQIFAMVSGEAGEAQLALADVDVRALIQAQIDAHKPSADARGNRLALRVSDAAARARTDCGKLTLCVGALVSNAVKFTRDGLIAINADLEQRDGAAWLAVSVSDTGLGIAPADVARILNPFVQVDAGATRAGGMGMGLALADRASKHLGGGLSVASEAGVGSTFTLRIPVSVRAADGAEQQAA